ncbi:MAG: hypothetical protein DMG96_27700 [Acidobacteria bacterium]|nr:MAG: hypothetical protein DMG96_27700 [Acidobacteriota bacterium]
MRNRRNVSSISFRFLPLSPAGLPAWRADAVPDEEAAPRVADGAHNSELTLQKKDRAELLRDSLVRLSPAHGEVINLVYYHGKSVKEVAEIVGVAEATLKMRMFYARQELAGLVAMA